ncbi:MAG: hypothetical protein WA510_05740 [Acidobacteriaceae bacterium]
MPAKERAGKGASSIRRPVPALAWDPWDSRDQDQAEEGALDQDQERGQETGGVKRPVNSYRLEDPQNNSGCLFS